MTDRIQLDAMTSDALEALYDQLDALRQVARGYCPDCGRGDAAPHVEDWERERKRAEKAEAALAHAREAAAWIRRNYPGLTTANERLAAALDTEPAAADVPELTAEEARDLAVELATDLYRAQDALAFVAECCAIADRNQQAITTGDVRTWLKGAQCGRQLAADQPDLYDKITQAATEATDRPA